MPQSFEQRRTFAADVLEASFFGAFIMAIEARKNELGLTQTQLADRTGREKTGISKLLSGPRNWTIRTMSDLATALDVRLEFSLVDKINAGRRFTATGVEYSSPAGQGSLDLTTQTHVVSNADPVLIDASKVIGTFRNYTGFMINTGQLDYFTPHSGGLQRETLYGTMRTPAPLTGGAPLTNTVAIPLSPQIDVVTAELRRLVVSQQKLLAEKDKQIAILTPPMMPLPTIFDPQSQASSKRWASLR